MTFQINLKIISNKAKNQFNSKHRKGATLPNLQIDKREELTVCNTRPSRTGIRTIETGLVLSEILQFSKLSILLR